MGLEPIGRDLNPARTQIGTWTHMLGLEPRQYADWDLNPWAGTQTWPDPDWDLNPRSFHWEHTWSQDLVNLRFLMSHCRKNSVRDKVIGKKWIYLERNTLHRQSVGHLRRQESPKYSVVSFYGLGNFIG